MLMSCGSFGASVPPFAPLVSDDGATQAGTSSALGFQTEDSSSNSAASSLSCLRAGANLRTRRFLRVAPLVEVSGLASGSTGMPR